MKRGAWAAALVSLLAVLTAAPARGASGTMPSLKASRTLVPYGKSVTLSGHVAGRGRVVLEADPFPFRAGFRAIASRKTTANGDYSFTARPSHANRYRVLVSRRGQTLRSPALSVYVDERVLVLSCNLCTGVNSAGRHTLTVNYAAEAPPGKVGVRGPVYFYYGMAGGNGPPATIGLAKQVALHRSGHALSYEISYPVDFPTAAFQFRVAACFKVAEPKDGVGLPGHHHCGDRTLTRQQYLGYLG